MKSVLSLRAMGHRFRTSLLLAHASAIFTVCYGQPREMVTTEAHAAVNSAPLRAPLGTRIELTLTGYNYTNRYIDEFYVDGQGGGNTGVSGPRTVGIGSVCCVSYRSGAAARKVKIRWQADACIFTDYIDGEGVKHERIHSYFKEREVQIDSYIPDFPHFFEVHFYPDGHVEAAMTEHESRSRLVLSKDREDKSKFVRCPNDIEPKK